MVYRTKDDSIAAVGSAEECAKQMGYTAVGSFYSMVYKVNKGECKKYEVVVSNSDVCDE
jgi:hypothetical protein